MTSDAEDTRNDARRHVAGGFACPYLAAAALRAARSAPPRTRRTGACAPTRAAAMDNTGGDGRGLHSSTFFLNLSRI